jgi:FG-GAP-like repeat
MKPPQSRHRSLGALVARTALALVGCLLAVCVSGAAGAVRADLSFAPGPPIAAGPAPNYAAVADLNGDGRLDLAVADRGYWNDLRILLGSGAGAFRPAGRPLAIGGQPGGMTAADFNGDAKPDLAVASADPNVVNVLLGDGSGGVTPASGAPVAVGGATTGMIAAADLNRDGKTDLVVPFSQGGYRVASLLGDGTGGFTRAAAPPARLGGGWDVSVAVADFTGDAKPDLAVANAALNDISLLRGDGAGKLDLVALAAKGTVTLLGDGAGSFRRAGAAAAIAGDSLVTADFDRDGKLDLAAPDIEANQVSVALGDGAGGFHVAALSPFPALAPLHAFAGDFNGDHEDDILALSTEGSPWRPVPRATSVLLQTPAAPPVPAARQVLSRSVFSTRRPIRLLAADGTHAAVATAKGKACGAVVVWSVRRPGSRSYPWCYEDGVSELALGASQVAWIEEGGGNNLEMTVMAARLAGGAAKQVDFETNGDRAGGDPTGDWVGVLRGGGSLLAYNAWQVVCTHQNADGGYCDWVGVGKRRLIRISRGRRSLVGSGPNAYPLAAVGGGRMAVTSEDGAVNVLAPSGKTVATVPADAGDPPRTVALSSSRLALERTFGLDLYDPRTAAKKASVPLGPAAALQLVGVTGKLALLRGPRSLLLVRLADGRFASLPLRSPGGAALVGAELTEAGLFSAYNLPKAARKGRIVFVPTARLLARFGR